MGGAAVFGGAAAELLHNVFVVLFAPAVGRILCEDVVYDNQEP